VLVVDDTEDAREMYTLYLEFVGMRVATASDGEEALRTVAAQSPDVVVMDLSMPGMDGWTATRLLKADPQWRHIPVIALTGQAMKGAEQSARDAGCDRYVMKPCLPDDLVRIIHEVLADPRERRASR
jgi:CheY-like chemotaxis protein